MSKKPNTSPGESLRRPRTRNQEEDSLRLRALLNSMGEGLIVTNETGHITSVNSYALAVLGCSQSDLVGKWFSGTIVAVNRHGQTLDAFERPIIRALTTGHPVSDYTNYLRKDGSMFPVFVTVSPIIMEGKPKGAIELFRDLTIERQLDIAKEEFVSLASHQLRTPASGVDAVLSMVLAGDLGPLTPQQHKYLSKAADSNTRLLQLIEDILDTAQIDAGKMELEKTTFNLCQLLLEVVEEQKLVLKRRQQTLKLDLPHTLNICADKEKIRTVFENLLSNASKYTHRGGTLTISAKLAGQTVEVAVADTGVGMGAEDLQRLYRKFVRFDNPLSTLSGGSGVGLYLVKNIVNLHRGDIIVESKVGEGSTFRVMLPVPVNEAVHD